MISSTFNFEDSRKENIFVYKWESVRKPKAVVQISHGMAEHAGRYDRFARALVKEGFAVYANDHRGHGRTAKTHDNEGIFADKDGWNLCISDMQELTGIIKKEQPGVPVFLFGHSMGSFLAQGYISKYGAGIDGCILSGTAGNGGSLVTMGNLIAKTISSVHGRNRKSRVLDKMSFGSYNNAFKPTSTSFDWLSRDNEEVNKYINDEWCGFVCTAGFFADLTSGLKWTHKKETMDKIPKHLPICFLAGDKDPVGNRTESIKKLIREYSQLGITDLSWTFYRDARHEILNEVNRDEVTGDIVGWLSQHISS
jgi:alpha-beta hydrolase superfamily lysophospholipase